MTRDELLQVAHDRLYPAVTNPNYLVLRSRRLIFAQWLSMMEGNLAVLDVGGRYQPYRPLLHGKIKNYLALDVQPTELVSVVGTGEAVPFQDESFDLVIATGVFEYFYRPHNAANEIHRVLKSGGKLLMSVASVAPRFVDEECWRYTPRALQSVLSSFSQVSIVPEVFSPGGLLRLINLGLHDFLKVKPLKFSYSITVCPVLNWLGRALEGAKLTKNDQWTGNYSVMATK